MFNSFGNLTLFDDDDVDVDGYMGSVDNSVIDTDEEQDCSTPVQGPATKTEQESTNRSYSEVLRSREAQAPASTLISFKSGSRDGAGPSKPKEGVQGSNERRRGGSQSKNIPKIDYELDLHEKSLHDARLEVKQMFRALSNSPSEKIVKVITGRGLGSDGGIPVIRNNIVGLFGTLNVNVEEINMGGAFIVTIPARTKLILSDDERRDKQVLLSDFCRAHLSKGMEIEAFAQAIGRRALRKFWMRIDKDIFGEKNKKYYLSIQVLIDFCEMKTVDVTLISTYIRCLCAKYEKSCKNIKFVNPASISTTDYRRELSRISKSLERRKNSQLCVVPYNIQSTFHWVLMVIDCPSMIVYWVDSLHKEADELTKFNVEKWLDFLPVVDKRREGDDDRPSDLCPASGRAEGGERLLWRPKWKWTSIWGPKQTDSVHCGFHVLKSMRRVLVEDPSQPTVMKMEGLNRTEDYKREEFKEVIEECIDHCREF